MGEECQSLNESPTTGVASLALSEIESLLNLYENSVNGAEQSLPSPPLSKAQGALLLVHAFRLHKDVAVVRYLIEKFQLNPLERIPDLTLPTAAQLGTTPNSSSPFGANAPQRRAGVSRRTRDSATSTTSSSSGCTPLEFLVLLPGDNRDYIQLLLQISSLSSSSFSDDSTSSVIIDALLLTARENKPTYVELLLDHLTSISPSSSPSSALSLQQINTPTLEYRNTALHIAAERNHSEVLSVLLSRGADPNSRNQQQNTPLHKCASVPPTPSSASCASSASENSLRILLDHGADLSLQNEQGDTPLLKAVRQANNNFIRFILQYSPSPSTSYSSSSSSISSSLPSWALLKNKNGFNALHEAALLGNESILRILLEAGFDPYETTSNIHNNALHLSISSTSAISQLRYSHIEVLLDHEKRKRESGERNEGENHPLLIVSTNLAGETPLHIACGGSGGRSSSSRVGYLSPGAGIEVNMLVELTPQQQTLALPSSGMSSGSTSLPSPLTIVRNKLQPGSVELVNFLLSKGAQIDLRDHKQQTPFYLAALSGNAYVLDSLITSLEPTPERILELFQRGREDNHDVRHVLSSALILTASTPEFPWSFEQLYQARKSIIRFDLEEETRLLRIAAENDSAGVFSTILKNLESSLTLYSLFFSQDLTNGSPLEVAIERFALDCLGIATHYLLKVRKETVKEEEKESFYKGLIGKIHKVKDGDGYTLIHRSAASSSLELLENIILLDQEQYKWKSLLVTEEDEEEYGGYVITGTALHVAVGTIQPKAVEVLTKYGADSNSREGNKTGATPLHLALELLLEKEDEGNTHDIVELEHIVLQLLKEGHADVMIENTEGVTAKQLVARCASKTVKASIS